MYPLHNPRDTIIRNVLLFPADGTTPRIIPKEFSEAASEINPVSFYTTSVELRSHYGKNNMLTTHCNFMDNNPNPLTLKCNEGEFHMYSNVSPALPVNRSAARVVGVDPKHVESKIFWRGDILFVKCEDWPGPIVAGGGAHKEYFNVDPTFQSTGEIILKKAYETDELEAWVKQQVESQRRAVQFDRNVNISLEMFYNIPRSHLPRPMNLDDHIECDRAWKKVLKYYELEEPLARDVCARCTNAGKPELKRCGRCKKVRYCSKECQKYDWKYHKRECVQG